MVYSTVIKYSFIKIIYSVTQEANFGNPHIAHWTEIVLIDFISIGIDMTADDCIRGYSIRKMLSVGAQVEVTIAAEQDAFVVLIGAGLTRLAVQAKRGHIRRFRTLDSAAQFLNKLGCRHAAIDLERWEPSQRTIAISTSS